MLGSRTGYVVWAIISTLAACTEPPPVDQVAQGGSSGASAGTNSGAGTGGNAGADAGGSSAGSLGSSGSAGTAGLTSGGSAGSGGSTSAGSGGLNSAGAGGMTVNTCMGFDEIVSQALFDEFFPLDIRHALYSYEGLVAAAATYPEFATSGDCATRKREVAAFLANMARETGRLMYAEQIQQDVYCQQGNEMYRCAAGESYYGRGPIQLSWNYNYGAASEALGLGTELLTNPDLVAQDSTIAWRTGLWFWTTSGSTTCHAAMMDGVGFGQTIRTINGPQECDGAWPEAVAERVSFYESYCAELGVDPGANTGC
jgi:predicted chitinase